jgi:hypothetical protein
MLFFMKKLSVIIFLALIPAIFLLSKCNTGSTSESTSSDKDTTAASSTPNYGGFNSQEEWGGHLVTIIGCGDCHTPKKMTPSGPVPDESLALSGHPAIMPIVAVDRKAMEKMGAFASNDLTAWVGPWGVSYAANITSDSTTGIGNWSFEQFETCMRKGKFMGLEKARDLLPPMPWQGFQNMTDGEMRAIFAYLKSTKPIRNIVPQADPPLLAQNH